MGPELLPRHREPEGTSTSTREGRINRSQLSQGQLYDRSLHGSPRVRPRHAPRLPLRPLHRSPAPRSHPRSPRGQGGRAIQSWGLPRLAPSQESPGEKRGSGVSRRPAENMPPGTPSLWGQLTHKKGACRTGTPQATCRTRGAPSLPGIQALLEVLGAHVVLGDLWAESLMNTRKACRSPFPAPEPGLAFPPLLTNGSLVKGHRKASRPPTLRARGPSAVHLLPLQWLNSELSPLPSVEPWSQPSDSLHPLFLHCDRPPCPPRSVEH